MKQGTAYNVIARKDVRDAEFEWIETLFNRDFKDTGRERNLEPGISIVVPVYRAYLTIDRLLNSFIAQTLDKELFEIILVFNGDDDGSYNLASTYMDVLPLRLYSVDIASASVARNFGMSLAKRQYLTFVDADDALEEEFLSNVFEHCAAHRIVVSPIVDMKDNKQDHDNSLNQRIMERQGMVCSPQDVVWLFGFNACKTFSTDLVNTISYNEELRSGEDGVFFSNFLTMSSCEVFFPEFSNNSAYIRNLSENSVSRQNESFDFNVVQRVETIRLLMDTAAREQESSSAVLSLAKSQANFIKRYAEKHPDALDKLEKYLDDTDFFTFPWKFLNEGNGHDLVVSYCFPPFVDTAGVIAAKRITERRRTVDVIYGDMSSVRSTDETNMFLCSRWVDNATQISGKPGFSNWNSISQFALDAHKVAKNGFVTKGGYDSLYTRAMWMQSHVAGFLIKREFPTILWTAEFSDPLRFGADGQQRHGEFTNNHVSKLLLQAISSFHVSTKDIETVFHLVELATFLTADEIIFTNENQKNYMLMPYPKKVRDLVSQKAIISRHPAPRSSLYRAQQAQYFLNPHRVHIGYFGAFYSNRSLSDVFQALTSLDSAVQNKIMLHIFTNNINATNELVEQLQISHCVTVNNYLPYLEFLNISTQFDVLLLNDVDTGTDLPFNPFLPSKLSDYKGSGSAVWAIVDEDSPLSHEKLDYMDNINDIPSITRTLQTIIDDKRILHDD